MDINKAIRKQKKSYKIFVLSMCFIFFILPLALFLYGDITWFLLSYLLFIEVMIVTALIARVIWEKLYFQCQNNKLKIKVGIFNSYNYIVLCHKVALVHTEKEKEDMEIVITTTVKGRNRRIRPIDIDFHKKYPVAARAYNKLKKINPENDYYYLVVKRGGYYKYQLLDLIYKNCVKAVYTDDAIENIKFARGQKQF